MFARFPALASTISNLILAFLLCTDLGQAQDTTSRHLYVASPGIRDYLEYGGHGILVFDINDQHRLGRRISLEGYGVDDEGKPVNVKGICGNAKTQRLYVSTKQHLICLDIQTDKVLWQREYPLGCDRMSMTPDGTTIYQPSFEQDRWYVLDASKGDVIDEIIPNSRAHNTVVSVDGAEAYLAGLGSPFLTVVNTADRKNIRTVGPFADAIRPFTVNGDRSRVFVNVNGLLGFEIGDLTTGKKLHRVEVTGVPRGQPLRHGCPAHGIAMSPDESQIWVADGFNSTVHVFDATVMPPTPITSIALRGQPGWVTFSIDGSIAWPSTGQAINTKTYQILAELTDEMGRAVESEKVLEIDFEGKAVVAVGDQFGRGMLQSD